MARSEHDDSSGDLEASSYGETYERFKNSLDAPTYNIFSNNSRYGDFPTQLRGEQHCSFAPLVVHLSLRRVCTPGERNLPLRLIYQGNLTHCLFTAREKKDDSLYVC